MKAPPFEYFCPATVAEAVDLLTTQENPKVLAGGQSLMAMLNLRYLLPDVLVDINRIPELVGIAVDTDIVRIGAMTRQRTIELDAGLQKIAPILSEAVRLVGHRQTRNRGTIGGSLCHLDPAAELATLALLYDAEIQVAGSGGSRRNIPIGSFIAGFMMPNIEPHEIVTAVDLPLWSPGHGYAFHEFARRHGDFALASAACLIERRGDGAVNRIAIAIGGIGPVPQRLHSAETSLIGTQGEPEVIETALDLCSELEVIGDFHGSADYRLSVARSMLRKSLKLAMARSSAYEHVA
jgi:carbon-monoxide dehydrogenase medium subunit